MPIINSLFGSDFMYVAVDSSRMKAIRTPGYTVYQFYKMDRTQWMALDTPLKRCTNDNKEANTTQCLTQYLEHKIGCSMGLARSDPKVVRYWHNSQIKAV